ncbi:zinc ABC transporter substrate-binding protein [bacterium]|nr:zinc ABC transporter substrate-binding protein [bacterium]
MIRTRAVVFLSLSVLVPTLAAGAESAEGHLFASILPQKFVLERLASPEFVVEALVGPGQSPATYDPSPRQMSRLAQARALFPMGVPFEHAWLPKIRESMPELLILDVSAPAGLEHVHHDHHDHGDELDPHFWTSPRETADMVTRIRDALSTLLPEKSELFEKRAATLLQELGDLDHELRALFSKSEGRSFVVFHPAWGHFAQLYGLEQISIEREGKEPGARGLAKSIDRVKELKMDVIFVQTQFSRDSAEAVARATGARLEVLDPLAEDYLVNLRLSAQAISEALK